MKSISEIVSANIRERRIKAGMSQADLAERAKMNPVSINRIENGARSASRESLELIANALSCTVNDFYSGSIVTTFQSGQPISGKDMIKEAVREALAEGPLPQKFETPSEFERLHARIAELEAITQKLSPESIEVALAYEAAGPGRKAMTRETLAMATLPSSKSKKLTR